MSLNRRHFLQGALLSTATAPLLLSSCTNPGESRPDWTLLDKELERTILRKEFFPDPVLIESLELLHHEGNFICRVRSKEGAEGLSVANNAQMASLYPIFSNRLQPFFPGKDARELEQLLKEVYVYRSNYKLQNLALWVPLATIEFAILDMLGHISGRSMGELIGKVAQPDIAVYRANNYRGRSAAESLERIKQNVEETGALALKIKVGGRMSNPEEPPGRTEELIPLVRKAFGDDMVIYADSNGSYNVPEAIRIGRMMEEYRIDFYEEPVPFDWYEGTREVADALSIPIAGGEQEPSLRNFRWLIGKGALDIVQPDIFYFGGMIRSMKVARMAHALGKTCVPHISGSGLGYLYMMHFVSALPNAGPFHEFKGFNRSIPLYSETSDLESRGGKVRVPSGPGLGVVLDPEYIGRHKPVEILS